VKDYNIKQVINILENNPTIKLSKHSMDRWFKRDIDMSYLEKCLNTLPLGIMKQNFNLFKLFYPHNSRKTLDICIVVDINDYCEIEIVTVFESNKSVRER
jgi:hypothetical protein